MLVLCKNTTEREELLVHNQVRGFKFIIVYDKLLFTVCISSCLKNGYCLPINISGDNRH